MITTGEREQIKAILQSPQWQVIERMAEIYCDRVKYDSMIADSQWETLRRLLINEGKVRGVKEFIQELYGELQKNQDVYTRVDNTNN